MAEVDDSVLDAQRVAALERKEKQIDPLLKTAAKQAQALKLVLADPPSGTRDEGIKVSHIAVVCLRGLHS